MLYLILARPTNLGMGYRMFLGLLPTEADSPAEAIAKNASPEEDDYLWAHCLTQPHRDGRLGRQTRIKPR